jgi:hypothetical protein
MSNQLDDELNQWLTETKSEVDQLTEEQIKTFYKKINPYGPGIRDLQDGKTVSVSYTNMKEDYIRQLSLTGIIGFMFRQLMEWQTPDEVKPVDIREYLKDPSIADAPKQITDPRLLRLYEENKTLMSERVSVFNFMKWIFDYDPDIHVRSSYSGNTTDSNRSVPDTEAIRRAIKFPNTVRNYESKEYEPKLEDLKDKSDKVEEQIIPPADTYHRIDRYINEHYEELQDVVYTLYGSRPDFDIALNAYDIHNSKEEAKRFRDKYSDQVIAPIYNIDINRWVLLGPYRKNRENIEFLNKNTEILRAMLDKREEDSQVAADIMKKRAKIKKAKNVKEVGANHSEFERFIKHNRSDVAKMGATRIEDPQIEDECPSDHVEVHSHVIGDGGRELKTHIIYNPVEAPATPSKSEKKEQKE